MSLYQPYYCEENIWHLCQSEQVRGWERQAVFISNSARMCALWQQKSALTADEPVVWDYHVILCARKGQAAWQVFDPDTRLGMPVAAGEYLRLCFPWAGQIQPQFAPEFRLIDADSYVAEFSSDRAHMRNKADGSWLQPPPAWPAIFRNERSNLSDYIDMSRSGTGSVVDLSGLQRFFQCD